MARFFESKMTKSILLIIGILLLVNGILGVALESLTLGVILTFAFSLCLILCGLCCNSKVIVIIKSIILFVFIVLMAYSIFVYAYGGHDKVTYQEDAVIVLGTVVIGDQPSTDLKNRLDATLEYHENNPDALIIVTGGQATDENDSEASVMFKYLTNADISADKIVMEDRATSTIENFQYASEFMNDRGVSNPSIAYISNDFHIFRAGMIARDAGFEQATHYHGKTPWHMIVPNGLRESVVTIRHFITT